MENILAKLAIFYDNIKTLLVILIIFHQKFGIDLAIFSF